MQEAVGMQLYKHATESVEYSSELGHSYYSH